MQQPAVPQISPEQVKAANKVKAVILQAQKMKLQGAKEETDPEYARLLALLRYWNQISRQPPSSDFTSGQRDALKYQIQAYKLLSQNKPLPRLLKQIVFDPKVLAEVQAPDQLLAQRVVEQAIKSNPKPPSLLRPLSLAEHQQRLLTPALLPPPLDPLALRAERERFLRTRVENRISELSSLPNNITDGGGLKLKALIELKSLKLLEYQRKLRTDIVNSLSQATTLSTAIDRSAYRHMKKQSLREARQTDKQERAQRTERDKREKQKHMDFLSSILSHGRELMTSHRTALTKAHKLGGAIVRFHQNYAKEEERRMQRNSQDRLNALKANDEEAYMKLLDKSKDTRITHLLNQTTSFLSTLTNAVEKQKASVQEVEVVGQEPAGDNADPTDYYETAHKTKEYVTEQSSLLVGGTLKDYQVRGLEWMVSLYNNRLNGILADEMGLGKTIQTLSLITYLIEKKKQTGPFLVIVPLSTVTNWVNEFDKWAPSVSKIVYKGSPNDRRALGLLVRAGNFNVLLTTYEYIINPKDRPVLCRIKWVYMIIDEGHRMKNAHSKLSTTLVQFYNTRYRLMLTGTPLQNNLPELWALLNFILPKIFNSVKSFDEWFNSPFANTTGQEKIGLNEEEQLLIIRRLHKVLRPFLLRRLKKDVESELPDKVETIIKCPMSALQHRLYDQIRNRRLGEGLQKKKALNNLVMQFRKVCNHPYVFDEVEESLNPMKLTDHNLYRVAGKFELLDRILPKFFAMDHRILMFFQMTQIMDIMEDYLRWKGFKYLRLDGNTKADDRTVMLNTFNKADDPPFIFLLSTRAGGLGLNLQTADTVIIYDSDWNPHQDLQAQDRAHRIGQKKEVRILRLVTSKSVEEAILARAQYKLDLDGKVIQAGKFDNKTTDREREDLLRTLLGGDEEDEEEEEKEAKEGEMDDGELNEIIARTEEELNLYNQMDAERRELEQQEHQKRGGKGQYQRLIQDAELPAMFLEDTSIKPVKSYAPVGRGARQRKDIAYDDGLNEDQFVTGLEQGDVEGFIERKRQRNQSILEKREKKRVHDEAKIAAGEEPSDESDFDNAEALELPDPEAPTIAVVEAPKVDVLDIESRTKLTRKFDRIYRNLEELEVDFEGYTRRRSGLYLSLPDRDDYKDYYSLIKRPISMQMIKSRIVNKFYSSAEPFAVDFRQMFTNAMTYNQEGSEVYEDATVMKQVFEALYVESFVDLKRSHEDQDYSANQKRSREDTDEDDE